MTVSNSSELDAAKARAVWSEYQRQHDLEQLVGQTAGIDPISGRIWIGESIEAVVARRNAEGFRNPLLFERIGSATYYRKGGHR